MTLNLTVENGIGTIDGYLHSKDYAEKNGLKESSIRRYIYLGKLDAIKVGNGWWIKEDEPLPPDLNRMKSDELIKYLKERSDKLDHGYFKPLELLDRKEQRGSIMRQPYYECRYVTCNGDCRNCIVMWIRR